MQASRGAKVTKTMEITAPPERRAYISVGGMTLMKPILTACLSLGVALTFAATAEAQDTTQTGAAPLPADSAPTTQAQGDTLGGDSTRSGYTVDSTAQQRAPGNQGTTADSLRDSTRIHPDSQAGASSTGASNSS